MLVSSLAGLNFHLVDSGFVSPVSKLAAMKKTGRIVGLLFILIMVTWGLGYYILDSIIYTPDYLSDIYQERTKIKIGVLIELIEVALVMGLTFILFPLLKKQSDVLAITYVGFRVFESMMLIVSLMAPLVLITLSQEFLQTAQVDTSYFETIGSLFKDLRIRWSLYVLAFFHPLAAMPMYWFLIKSRLVPRFLSFWGFIAAVLLILEEVILESFGLSFLRISGTPITGIAMGLNEIFLGAWLLIKGFNEHRY